MSWSWLLKTAVSIFVFCGLLLGIESAYRRYYANGLRASRCEKQGGTLISTGEIVICEYGFKQ